MDYYTIAPINHLELVKDEPRHLVVASFLDNDKVYDFYQKQGIQKHKIILDNGSLEFNEPINRDTFLDYARELYVDAIVCPDYIRDAVRTMNETEVFFDSLSENELRKYHLIGVVHGRDLTEFITCYHKLLTICDIIAFTAKDEWTKGWRDHNGIVRSFLTYYLDNHLPGLAEIHLLGLNFVKELYYTNPKVRSIDTSMPFKLAAKNEALGLGSSHMGMFDFNVKLNKKQQQLGVQNIQFLKDLCDLKYQTNKFVKK